MKVKVLKAITTRVPEGTIMEMTDAQVQIFKDKVELVAAGQAIEAPEAAKVSKKRTAAKKIETE